LVGLPVAPFGKRESPPAVEEIKGADRPVGLFVVMPTVWAAFCQRNGKNPVTAVAGSVLLRRH